MTDPSRYTDGTMMCATDEPMAATFAEIAALTATTYMPHHEDEANDRLMAAAPDLAANLKNLCEWMMVAEDSGILGDKPRAAIQSAIAVLARVGVTV